MADAAAASDIYLGRQPILDRSQRIVAYELLFRSSLRNFADVTDQALATATVIANAFSQLSIGDALGDCRGFINVDEEMLFTGFLDVLPRHAVVLEILETVRITPAIVDRCRTLRDAGFTLALDDVAQLGPETRELLPLVDIVKVDLHALAADALPALAQQIRALGLRALAEKVDTPEQAKHCLDLGFDLFQGYYYAKPKIIKGRKLDQSQLTLLRVMNLVLADAEDREIEAVLKPQPGLMLSLLRLTNSVAVGSPVAIRSLRQAISVLGRRQLLRWLQLLLYSSAGPAGAVPSPLLVTAAARARLMENLAAHLSPRDAAFADRAFMTGILSLTPALLGMPLEEIVPQLALDAESLAALGVPVPRRGRLGELLELAERLEADAASPAPAAPMPALTVPAGLDAQAINTSLAQALAWANGVGRDH